MMLKFWLIHLHKLSAEMPRGISVPDNKPIIITFLAMEKVILLCTYKTQGGVNGSAPP